MQPELVPRSSPSAASNPAWSQRHHVEAESSSQAGRKPCQGTQSAAARPAPPRQTATAYLPRHRGNRSRNNGCPRITMKRLGKDWGFYLGLARSWSFSMLGDRAGQRRCGKTCQQAERTPRVGASSSTMAGLEAARAPEGVPTGCSTVTRGETAEAFAAEPPQIGRAALLGEQALGMGAQAAITRRGRR